MKPIELFQALPYPLKVVAASAHGLRLQRQRYGRDTGARIAAALDRETWTLERWREHCDGSLRALLARARARVPHYRDAWQGRTGDPDRLADWPLLDKEPLRRDPESFLADDLDRRQLLREQTSGSTGTPLRLYWSRETAHRWYALVEARSRCWYGVDRRRRWAILGGRLVAEQARRRPPFWVWNAAMLQLYCSAYHLAPDLVPSYLEAFEEHEIHHLYGYGSALYALARGLEERGLEKRARKLGLAVVVTNAEPLYEHQRALLERVFACPVRETYGMAELVAAASECEHGRLHLWPEVGRIELLDPSSQRCFDPWLELERTGADAVEGELVCTGLLNSDQPLIRYRVGDRARIAVGSCACGRTLPVLDQVEGRVDDVVITPDGRRIGRLDPVFKGDSSIREAQIVQEERHSLRLLVVPADDFDSATAESLQRRLAERVGNMEIRLETVTAIPRSAAGKVRLVLNRLEPEDLERRAPTIGGAGEP